VRLAHQAPHPAGPRLVTHVAHVDRFGNAITHLDADQLAAWLGTASAAAIVLHAHGAGGARLTEVRGLVGTYGEPGDTAQGPVALIGSSGLLEIALPGRHAALALGLAPGDTIELHLGG
jgi:S-adenosylmethionine hydrolase